MAVLRFDLALRLFTFTFVVLAIPYFLSFSEEFRGNVQFYGELLLYALVMFAFQHQLNLVESKNEKRFWNYLTIAFASWLLARCAVVLLPKMLENPMRYIWVDVIYLIYYLFFFLAAELRPDVNQEETSDRNAQKIKLLGFIAFLTTLLTYFILIPSDFAPQTYEAFLPSYYLFLALDLVVLVRFFELKRCSKSVKWGTIYGLIALGSVQFFLLDLIDWCIYAGIAKDTWGTKMDLVWGLPLVTIVIAARLYHHGRGAAEIEVHRKSVVPKSPLILLTFLLLFIHFPVSYFDLFGAASRRAHEVAIFFGFVALGSLAILEDSLLRKRTATLEIQRRNAQKREEEKRTALMESEERFKQAVSVIPFGLFMFDKNLRLLEFNHPCEEIFGYSKDEFMGKSIEELTHPEDFNKETVMLQKLLQDKIQQYRFIKRCLTKDEQIVWANIAGTSVRDENRNFLYGLCVIEDITEQKQIQEQLAQSQRMEAIGILAGGVAHDFNNLLTVILCNVELLNLQIEAGSKLKKPADAIEKAAMHAASMTRQLLAFSRKQFLAAQIIDLNAIVADMEEMIRRLIGENIELKAALGKDVGRVMVDPGQISQVIMNIILNARDAIQDTGRILIKTSNEYLNAAHLEKLNETLAPGAYTRLSISDTGCGMDAKTMERIFEPFFTTKGKERGTGLGLSTSYGIVRQSGGFIRASSKPGKGTTFDIYLPSTEQKVTGKELKHASKETRSGSETILLAEDEDAIRTLARTVLTRAGYRVIEAKDGLEAIEICEHERDPFHLIVTDVVMPRMSGPKAVERIMQIHPGIKVIFTSGYADDATLRHGVSGRSGNFLAKPFKVETLLQKVREVLDENETV
ncbi:PAS domain S-box protein [bacterium]|nr:PAS domain S-box protein [bacterium]